jgi:hypothetical protein
MCVIIHILYIRIVKFVAKLLWTASEKVIKFYCTHPEQQVNFSSAIGSHADRKHLRMTFRGTSFNRGAVSEVGGRAFALRWGFDR